eukprot:721268-Rhodomonas_salina.1
MHTPRRSDIFVELRLEVIDVDREHRLGHLRLVAATAHEEHRAAQHQHCGAHAARNPRDHRRIAAASAATVLLGAWLGVGDRVGVRGVDIDVARRGGVDGDRGDACHTGEGHVVEHGLALVLVDDQHLH